MKNHEFRYDSEESDIDHSVENNNVKIDEDDNNTNHIVIENNNHSKKIYTSFQT